ncbi:MAG: CBS domain-containing protein [Actinomycetes bacterium]
MRADEIAVDYPSVRLDTPAVEAAHLLAAEKLPGLLVLDQTGHPLCVLPGSQVLRFIIPSYVQEDINLAGVLSDEAVRDFTARLSGNTVRDVLPSTPQPLPVVEADTTGMEMAALMARLHSPLVAVVRDGDLVGAVTAAHLLEVLLPT